MGRWQEPSAAPEYHKNMTSHICTNWNHNYSNMACTELIGQSIVTPFQMCWVALTAWLRNSLGPSPLCLNMISGLRKNLPLSSIYRRCSFLKDMPLVWKVSVGELLRVSFPCQRDTSFSNCVGISCKNKGKHLCDVGPVAISNKGEPW